MPLWFDVLGIMTVVIAVFALILAWLGIVWRNQVIAVTSLVILASAVVGFILTTCVVLVVDIFVTIP
jgi:hypothetical protein